MFLNFLYLLCQTLHFSSDLNEFFCTAFLLPQLSVAVIPIRLKTETLNVNVRRLVVEFPTNVEQVTN